MRLVHSWPRLENGHAVACTALPRSMMFAYVVVAGRIGTCRMHCLYSVQSSPVCDDIDHCVVFYVPTSAYWLFVFVRAF